MTDTRFFMNEEGAKNNKSFLKSLRTLFNTEVYLEGLFFGLIFRKLYFNIYRGEI